ncbi:MAG: CvpA family protein [Bacteroidales bacterium]|nr:CvpA family protein [Bacteroidales bacterium]
MGILDIILLVCFIPAIVQGISKGFVKQAISAISILVGAWAAFRFSRLVSVWLSQYLSIDPKVLNIIAFSVIVILAVFLLFWIGELLTRVIKITALGWLNTLLGILLGVLTVALILGLLIMVFEGMNDKFSIVKPGTLDNAVVYQFLKDFAQTVFPYLKNFVTGAPAANV